METHLDSVMVTGIYKVPQVRMRRMNKEATVTMFTLTSDVTSQENMVLYKVFFWFLSR